MTKPSGCAALGIDVSKRKVDVALLYPDQRLHSSVFPNDAKGHKRLVAWVKKRVSTAVEEWFIRAFREAVHAAGG